MRDDLILARMCHLDDRMESENLTARNQRLAWTQNNAYFNSTAHLRSENQSIRVGDLVVIFRPSMLLPIKHHDMMKLNDGWQGLSRFKAKPPDSTYYLLEDLDGTPMKHQSASDHWIKKYYPRLPPERPLVDQQTSTNENIDKNSTSTPHSTLPIFAVPSGEQPDASRQTVWWRKTIHALWEIALWLTFFVLLVLWIRSFVFFVFCLMDACWKTWKLDEDEKSMIGGNRARRGKMSCWLAIVGILV